MIFHYEKKIISRSIFLNKHSSFDINNNRLLESYTHYYIQNQELHY